MILDVVLHGVTFLVGFAAALSAALLLVLSYKSYGPLGMVPYLPGMTVSLAVGWLLIAAAFLGH